MENQHHSEVIFLKDAKQLSIALKSLTFKLKSQRHCHIVISLSELNQIMAKGPFLPLIFENKRGAPKFMLNSLLGVSIAADIQSNVRTRRAGVLLSQMYSVLLQESRSD